MKIVSGGTVTALLVAVEIAREDAHERALPDAVDADQPGPLTRPDLERDLVEEGVASGVRVLELGDDEGAQDAAASSSRSRSQPAS